MTCIYPNLLIITSVCAEFIIVPSLPSLPSLRSLQHIATLMPYKFNFTGKPMNHTSASVVLIIYLCVLPPLRKINFPKLHLLPLPIDGTEAVKT